jgi:imidazoleglycerol phosphate dehydratase HisB
MGGQDHCCVINCSNKRKTIKRTGRLHFPIDINDVQSEVDISSESDCETTISR